MKTTSLFLTIAFLVLCNNLFCDVIPDNTHFVNKCVVITNLDEYPAVSLLGYVEDVGANDNYCYLISDAECLHKGYKYNTLHIYAALQSYLSDKDIEHLNLPEDENSIVSDPEIDPCGAYYPNDDPTVSIGEFYKILGFTNNTIVLFKWKEVIKYSDATPDSTKLFTYEGDLSELSQQFPALSNLEDHTKYGFPTELCPNPTTGNLTLNMNNIFLGEINISIYSLDGRMLKSFLYNKSGMIADVLLPNLDLSSGGYIVRLEYGGIVESERLIIN